MKVTRFLQLVKNYTLHFFFPKTCFNCKRDLSACADGPLCEGCYGELKVPGPHICKRCGAVLKSGGAHCYACRGSKEKQYKCKCIRAAFVFNASSRALVHALKYQGIDYVAAYMGKLMAEKMSDYPELNGIDVIIPVPLHVKKKRARGYNQSELLARSLAQQTGLALDVKSLVRLRNTPSQTKLNRPGRLANMVGAFSCVQPEQVKGKTVLLIDDVATTGATLEGCAVALKQAKAKRVLAYSFARE